MDYIVKQMCVGGKFMTAFLRFRLEPLSVNQRLGTTHNRSACCHQICAPPNHIVHIAGSGLWCNEIRLASSTFKVTYCLRGGQKFEQYVDDSTTQQTRKQGSNSNDLKAMTTSLAVVHLQRKFSQDKMNHYIVSEAIILLARTLSGFLDYAIVEAVINNNVRTPQTTRQRKRCQGVAQSMSLGMLAFVQMAICCNGVHTLYVMAVMACFLHSLQNQLVALINSVWVL